MEDILPRRKHCGLILLDSCDYLSRPYSILSCILFFDFSVLCCWYSRLGLAVLWYCHWLLLRRPGEASRQTITEYVSAFLCNFLLFYRLLAYCGKIDISVFFVSSSFSFLRHGSLPSVCAVPLSPLDKANWHSAVKFCFTAILLFVFTGRSWVHVS